MIAIFSNWLQVTKQVVDLQYVVPVGYEIQYDTVHRWVRNGAVVGISIWFGALYAVFVTASYRYGGIFVGQTGRRQK